VLDGGGWQLKRIVLLAALGSGCGTTESDFIEATPAEDIANLGKGTPDVMVGISCKSLCTTKREFDSINYCVIATIEVGQPRLVCNLRRGGGSAPGYAFNKLVDVPATVDLSSLPVSGSVPIEMCEAANCKSKMPVEDVPVIDACSVYAYRPSETEKFLVCSYHEEHPTEHFR
jgi:hypothetical protein